MADSGKWLLPDIPTDARDEAFDKHMPKLQEMIIAFRHGSDSTRLAVQVAGENS